MKKSTFAFGILALVFTIQTPAATAEYLGRTQIQFQDSNPARQIDRVAENPRAVFENFQPGLDRGSKVVSQTQVGGTESSPTLKVSIRKCVFFVCETVDLDAEARIEAVRGTCTGNLKVTADLSRSSPLLRDNFKALEISVCTQVSGTQAVVTLDFAALPTDVYPSGLGASEVLKMLKLQVQPLTKAFEKSLSGLR